MQDTIQVAARELLQRFGLENCHVNVSYREMFEDYYVNIDCGDDAKLLIGYHGENMFALQHILRLIVNKGLEKRVAIFVDVDGYRKRQEQSVIELTERKVDALRMQKRSQSLPPMSPYFRRVVHLYVRKPEFSDIASLSQGHDDQRQVVLSLAEEQ